jgi:hypothetical protein
LRILFFKRVRRIGLHIPESGLRRSITFEIYEVIRLTEAERAACIKASQSVLDKHRKELDPKLFAYLGAL